jgi:hypothetical protein
MGPDPRLQKDPNDLLRSHYKDALAMAMEARRKDLERQTGVLAQARGGNLLGAGILNNMPALQQAGAEQIYKAMHAPVHVKSMEEAAKASEAYSKADLANQALDPNSTYSKAAVLAFHHNPAVFDVLAKNMAKQQGIDELDAKRNLYNQTKGLSATELGQFYTTLKSGGDYSKQRAEEAHQAAQAKHERIKADSLEMELSTKQAYQDAIKDEGSAISQYVRAIAKMAIPRSAQREIPNFDKLTASQILSSFPQIQATVVGLLRDRIEYAAGFQASTTVKPGWQVSASPVQDDSDALGVRWVANPEGVKRKGDVVDYEAASANALMGATEFFRLAGAESGVEIAASSPKGIAMLSALEQFARNAARMNKEAGASLERSIQEVKHKGSFMPNDFIIGGKGKKAGVMAALSEINKEHMVLASLYNISEIDIPKGVIPANPPTWLPMTVKDVGKEKVFYFKYHNRDLRYVNRKGKWYGEFKDDDGKWNLGKQAPTRVS